MLAVNIKQKYDLVLRHFFSGIFEDRRIEKMQTIKTTEPKSMLSMVISDAVTNNPWEIIEFRWSEIMNAPDSARALKFLLERTYEISKDAEPINQIDQVLIKMVDRIVKAAFVQLKVYRDFTKSHEIWKSEKRNAKRKNLDFKTEEPRIGEGNQPADIYVRLGLPIRWASETLGHEGARRMFKSLSLESTLPLDEMENPDWIDPYTGEVTEKDKVRFSMSLSSVMDEAEYVLDDNLRWTEETYKDFQKAQTGGFNADRDDVVLFDDDTDSLEKDFEFKKDLATTDEANELREFYKPMVDKIRKTIDNTLAYYQAIAWEHEYDFSDIMLLTQEAVRNSEPVKDFMREMRRIALQHKPQDIAAQMLPLQNSFCFTEDDLNTVIVKNEPEVWLRVSKNKISVKDTIGLDDWINEQGDDFLAQFNDGSPTWLDITDTELDSFSEDTVFQYVLAAAPEKLKKAFDPTIDPSIAKKVFWEEVAKYPGEVTQYPDGRIERDIANHPAFYYGQLASALSGTSNPEAQIAAGWNKFRATVCPKGANAYDNAILSGKNQKEAMKAFWYEFNKAHPRQVKIGKMLTTGLVLENNRTVSWHVASIQLAANELEIDKDMAERIIKALESKKVGGEFLTSLQKKFGATA